MADDPDASPDPSPAGEPLLLTIPEAAVKTGLSVKALTRRIERGTLPSELHKGRRLIRAGELERLNTSQPGSPAEESPGELVKWQQMYERERQEREQADARTRELELQLVAIANAGPIRAMRLRHELRSKL